MDQEQFKKYIAERRKLDTQYGNGNINKLDNIITLEGIIDKNDIIIVNNNIQITIINMNKIMHSFYNLIF